MKWEVKDTPGSSDPAYVSTGIRERFAVVDGVFETPDDLDAAAQRRLEAAGHTPIETGDDETDSADDEDVEAAVDELEEGDAEPEPDDEYADMDRSALYEEYKARDGPASWNEVDVGFLRAELRAHDDGDDFTEPDEV